LIDDEVSRIIEEGKNKAREILTTHKEALHAISKKLAEVETLERDEYETLLKQHGVEIKDAYKSMYAEGDKVGDPTKDFGEAPVDEATEPIDFTPKTPESKRPDEQQDESIKPKEPDTDSKHD
jgi:cell division protease FtsH